MAQFLIPEARAERPLKHRLALAGLAALLLALAQQPFGLFPLAWVALVPFLAALRDQSASRRATIGGSLGLTYALVAGHWAPIHLGLASLTPVLGWAAGAALVALAAGCAPGRWGALPRVVVLATAWAGMEYSLFELVPLGLPGLGLGYTQVPDAPFLQLASVIGCYGLSFAVALLNGVAFEVLAGSRMRTWVLGLATVLTLAVVHGAGAERITDRPDAPLIVSLIQASDADLASLLALTDQSLQVSPQLVVWPSESVEKSRREEDESLSRIGACARELDTTIVAPVQATPTTPETSHVIGRDGQLLGQRPRSPVIPLAGGGPFLRSGTVLTNPARLGLLLGWEMEVPALACYQVRDDAELLVASASGRRDIGWAGRGQRTAVVRMRAVETHRFIIQVNGFGLSQIVDPYGREQLRTGAGLIWAVGYAGTMSGYTPYVIWGRWFGPVSAALAAAVLLLAGVGALWRAAGRPAGGRVGPEAPHEGGDTDGVPKTD